MTDVAQTGLLPAAQIAQQTAAVESPNGIFYGTFGDTHLAEPDLARVVQAVPIAIAKGLARHAYYFVPLTVADEEEVLIAPSYTVDLGDRAVCHRNVEFDSAEMTFISTRTIRQQTSNEIRLSRYLQPTCTSHPLPTRLTRINGPPNRMPVRCFFPPSTARKLN